MSPELLTAIAGVILSAIGVIVVPSYLSRRAERAAIAREEVARLLALESGSDVSWEAINRAIVRERDALQVKLDVQQKAHHDEIDSMRRQSDVELRALRESMQISADSMRQRMDGEAADMKMRYDSQITDLSTRLAECQKKVRDLTIEIYELSKMLPPPQRPA